MESFGGKRRLVSLVAGCLCHFSSWPNHDSADNLLTETRAIKDQNLQESTIDVGLRLVRTITSTRER